MAEPITIPLCVPENAQEIRGIIREQQQKIDQLAAQLAEVDKALEEYKHRFGDD